jgi:hypothetical protein
MQQMTVCVLREKLKTHISVTFVLMDHLAIFTILRAAIVILENSPFQIGLDVFVIVLQGDISIQISICAISAWLGRRVIQL